MSRKDIIKVEHREVTPQDVAKISVVAPHSTFSIIRDFRVVDKFVLQLEAQLLDRNVSIELSEAAAEWLADKGYDDKMGARPLARVIQEHIKRPLAEELLFGKLAKGGLVQVGETDGKLTLSYLPPEKPKLTRGKPPLLTAD